MQKFLICVGLFGMFGLIYFAIFTDCDQPEQRESAVSEILSGDHTIRALNSHTTTTGELNGGYFLFVGDIHGSITTSTELRFAWLGNDGDYIITDLPLSKIKIRINNKKSVPSVKFKWTRCNFTTPEQIKNSIIYAVIVCNDKDMPQQTAENLQNLFKSE